MKTYRNLNKDEITVLKSQDCSADDWSQISVSKGFKPAFIKNVHFTGTAQLGVFNKTFDLQSGRQKHSGIYNAHMHNCMVGDDVYISNVRNSLANYKIGKEVYIENVDILEVTGPTAFGNDTEVNVLDETGGRKVPIFNGLSAQMAYILAMYRHRPQMIQAVNAMVKTFTDQQTSNTGTIGDFSRLVNSRTIRNVNIGPSSCIDGAEFLFNGSINSTPSAPVNVGAGVIMKNFILCSGSTVSDSAIIDHCFIGQACELGKHYSAAHSVFFANCVGFHGEACSVFAGPYTVTHHKSTLLIAGMFSFLNAGSGSNQSNHMYKLGPVHQGIVERGSKTTSDSYLLWPARVGPFTLVMGRHYKNSDTSNLPFSYLIESNDESILVPGINLRSVGTIRDAQKWPKRDKRKDPDKQDAINFKLLSPYTIQKMIEGRNILIRLKEYSGEKSEFYSYENVKITRSALDKGVDLYNLAIEKFLGNSLINRLGDRSYDTDGDVRERLKPDTDIGTGKWIDVAGLLAPMNVVEDLIDKIENGSVKDIDGIKQEFNRMFENYDDYEWTWSIDTLLKEAGKNMHSIWANDVIELIKKWRKSVVELDRLLYNDAKKEFTLISQTGFGIDGDKETRMLDFEQVRGEFEKNPQVSAIKTHIKEKTALANEVINRMKAVRTQVM